MPLVLINDSKCTFELKFVDKLKFDTLLDKVLISILDKLRTWFRGLRVLYKKRVFTFSKPNVLVFRPSLKVFRFGMY